MKKILPLAAVALIALSGCSAQSAEVDAPTPSATTPAPSSTPENSPAPQAGVVTYQVRAMYADKSPAPASIAWSAPLREFDDISGEWEDSTTEFASGDYAQVLVTPSDSGVKLQCAILVNGVQMDFAELEDSSDRAKCEYKLP